MKLEKLLGESEYMRGLIRQVEGKVSEEVNKRLRQEFENKNWLEQKMSLLKQELVIKYYSMSYIIKKEKR